MYTIPTKQLDIITHYALPYNAKAKPIERFFRTFEEQFGKLWQSYCGNNPNNRPKRLKNLNRDQYPTFEVWKEIHDMYIDKNYNMAPHEGNGMDGKSPYEVYHENLVEKRVAPKEVLRLFMMRTTRALKVQRNGIRLFDKSLLPAVKPKPLQLETWEYLRHCYRNSYRAHIKVISMM